MSSRDFREILENVVDGEVQRNLKLKRLELDQRKSSNVEEALLIRTKTLRRLS